MFQLMFARKTNVIVLTAEIITLKLCNLCAQNAQTEAHTKNQLHNHRYMFYSTYLHTCVVFVILSQKWKNY